MTKRRRRVRRLGLLLALLGLGGAATAAYRRRQLARSSDQFRSRYGSD